MIYSNDLLMMRTLAFFVLRTISETLMVLSPLLQNLSCMTFHGTYRCGVDIDEVN